MIHFIRACGPFGFLLGAITIIILILTVRNFSGREGKGTIVLVGLIGAAVGFLGQTTAIYRSLTVILPADSIDPGIVKAGLAESFSSTWWGTGILGFSLLIWLTTTLKNRKTEMK